MNKILIQSMRIQQCEDCPEPATYRVTEYRGELMHHHIVCEQHVEQWFTNLNGDA